MKGYDGIIYSVGEDILIWFKDYCTVRFIFPYEILSIVGRFDLLPSDIDYCDYMCLQITGLYRRQKKLISSYLLKYLFFHTLHTINFINNQYTIVTFPVNSKSRATLIEYWKKEGRLICKLFYNGKKKISLLEGL